MKQSKASQTLLAIITIFTVMMALIVPSPAYAAKEPPPPPPPPSSDTGGKISGPSHAPEKDTSSGPTAAAADIGTPVSLAAELTTDMLSSADVSQPVKFCVGGITCIFYDDIEKALKAIAIAPDATGTLYVASNYSLSGTPGHKGGLSIDQASATWVDPAMDLTMQGGVNIVTNAPLGTSTLNQMLSINGIKAGDGVNPASSFTLDSFVSNVSALLGNALSVTNSNNVTLSNLTVTRSNGLVFSIPVASIGNGIHIQDSNHVTLSNVNVSNTTTGGSPLLPADGLSITGSQNISMTNVTASSTKVYGAYLNGNSNGLSITNSAFNSSGYAGLYVSGQNGAVTLTNVSALDNGGNVGDAVKALLPGQASGAAFVNNSGALTITGGFYTNNATSGLWVFNQTGGDISLTNGIFAANETTGFTALAPLLTDDISVVNTGFIANGDNGLTALSLGNISLNDSLFSNNSGEGANATSLSGDVVVDPTTFSGNTGNGLTVVALVGNVTLEDSVFTGNSGAGAAVTAILGTVDINNNQFTDNHGNGLTALATGNITLEDSGFYRNGGDGASVTSLAGDVSVDPSIFAGNTSNGLTTVAVFGDVSLDHSGFFGNGKNGADASAVLGGVGVENSLFAGNGDNGLTALALDTVFLGESGFFGNGRDGAFVTSLFGNVGVDQSGFAGNNGNGLKALASGGIALGNSGFFGNGGDGAFATSLLGGVAVMDNAFAGNDGNGLTASSLNDVLLTDSGFFGNGGDGAFTTSLLGNTDVVGNAFIANGKNGLTAFSLGDIFLAGVFAGANEDNGAALTSGVGDVGVFESVFGTPFEAATTGGGPVNFGNGDNGLVVTTLVGDVLLDNVEANLNGENGIVVTSLLGDICGETVSANANDVIGVLLTSVVGSVDVEDSQFDINGGVGLVAAGAEDVFLGWSDASGNQYAGATLVSLGDVVVTNSQFLGASQVLPQVYGPQMLGLGVVGGNVYLDSENGLSAADLDPMDYGVNASGNGVMGALVLSGGDILIGDSAFNENGGSVANLGLLSLLGDGVVAVGGLGGNGITYMVNTEANGNTSFGAALFNTDAVSTYDSAFDTNGVGGLLGVSFGDVEMIDIDASGNSLIGAATLSGGYTTVINSMFDDNLGGAGLFSVAFGPIWAENVDASGNGILGAGLVSVNLNDFFDFSVQNSACSEDNAYSGDICVNGMTANDNGFIGAAILGTGNVEVDNSQFTGNDAFGSLLGIIPGGGLVVLGGNSTVLDQVTADQNYGFGAVVGNTGGVYDLITNLIDSNNSSAGAFSQAVTGSATMFNLGDLPIFTDTGDIAITNSSFSHNGDFGLLGVSNGDIYLYHVQANENDGFGAALSAEGNIWVRNSTFNDNEGGFGLSATIFSPDVSTLTAATHKVRLSGVSADSNETFGAMVLAATTDIVDVSVTDSNFNNNEGPTTGGLGVLTTGDIFLKHVTADGNAGDGADLFGASVVIHDSHFNFNDGYGIVINSLTHTGIFDSNACYNRLGADLISTVNLFKDNFTEICEEGGGGGPTVETPPLPWQIINVMTDPGKNSGTLSCLFGTTFLYLEKQTSPTPDFEWARSVLSACIVPGGSVGTFLGLAQGALPGPLPDGITFQGKAFDLSIVGPTGQPIDVLGGPMMVRFTLPDGFTLPAGKKLDILWWNPATNKWVELNTYAGGKYAWGFASNDGTFALTIK